MNQKKYEREKQIILDELNASDGTENDVEIAKNKLKKLNRGMGSNHENPDAVNIAL